MEYKQEAYEKPKIEIVFLRGQDVLTGSKEPGAGDGWTDDPFAER